MIEWISIALVSIAILTDFLLLIFWVANFKEYESSLTDLPSVDILVAARNEEEAIINCLNSLLSLDYPIDKLNIWIGDDESTDNTWQLVKDFTSKHSHIRGLRISKDVITANGKANALAELAQAGKADWIFITDADIQVPHSWLKSMIGAANNENAALITGTSLVEGDHWFAKFQRLDWLYATAMLKVISDLGIPVTTMGNNMAIKRNAYEDVGGFESLPFSVTEDLELFKKVKKKYQTLNVFNAEVLNKSTPQVTILELLLQRKRWMRGAFELPIQLLGILLLQAFYLPAILVLLTINPVVGLVFFCTKWILKYAFGVLSVKKLNEKVSLLDSFVAELFLMFFSLASVFYYLWPGKIYWKGRKY